MIQVNVTTFIYNGTVEVTVQTGQDLDFITLHAADMLSVQLESVTRYATASTETGTVIPSQLFRYSPQDYVVVRFGTRQAATGSDPDSSGRLVLKFSYQANLVDGGLSGLYLSTYTDYKDSDDSVGVQNNIASTQFEFYDARKVFPCFDEPAFKTPFTITIIHDRSMNATFSNMDLISSESVNNDWIISRFRETPPMASYLVALLVSDFVCVNRVDNGVTYRVCAARMYQHKLDYALGLGPKVLQYLESLTDFKSPLNKVDMVAIPYFNYGAMENWGLITYRETGLLYSDQDTTSATKFSIASVIAHELAHFVSRIY